MAEQRPTAAAPLLLTPGPLSTSPAVKAAMLRDYGSRDEAFIEMSERVRRELLSLCNGGKTHLCVPLQGSGSFAIEAMIANQLPPRGRLLNLVNGAYGRRITEICRYLGRRVSEAQMQEDQPVDAAALDRRLADDDDVTHVAMVYCETTSGILNPLDDVAEVVAKHGKRLLLDAVSAFGALPLDAARLPFAAIAVSANKCLQGAPGLGFVIAPRDSFAATAGNAHSLSLDLYAQQQCLEAGGQWRFTPPTHCLAALDQALRELREEGGVAVRGRRYEENRRALTAGMRALGFQTLLPDELQAPIIVTFLAPRDEAFTFGEFYRQLKDRGYVIYPGKLTRTESFRIGCIGHLGPEEMQAAATAVAQALTAMGVKCAAPAPPD